MILLNNMFTLRNFSKIRHPEKQYLDLIRHTLRYGHKEKGRNGNVITHIGAAMRFQLYDEYRKHQPIIPLMTTKKLAWKTCLKELLWFMKGDTDNTTLQEHINKKDRGATVLYIGCSKRDKFTQEGDLT